MNYNTVFKADIPSGRSSPEFCSYPTRRQHRRIVLPTGATFNSVLDDRLKSVTCARLLSILPVSPTYGSVHITYLTGLERVANHACGIRSKSDETLDMGLCRPVHQLVVS